MLLKWIALGLVLYFVFKYWRPPAVVEGKRQQEERIQKEDVEIRRTPKDDRGDFIDYEEVD